MMLWAAIAALTAGAVLVLVWPLARARPKDDRLARDLAVYRDQLRELDAEVERGIIRPEERDAAKIEIERRMLRAADAGDDKPLTMRPAKSGLIALVVAAALPLVAVPIYFRLGEPEMPDRPLAERQDAQEHRVATARFEDMAARLAQRLRETPDDIQGWRLLGRTYGVLERHADSAAAYRRAAQLDPTDAGTLSLLGEALVYENAGEVPQEAIQAFDRALLADPMEPASRFYRALAFVQAGDAKSAYDGWLALAKDTPADAAWREVLMRNLEGVARRLGVDLAAVLPPPPTAGPTADQVDAAARMSAVDRQAFIRGMVDRLAERLKDQPDDLQGWMRLGQAYVVLERPADARAAYAKALALATPNSVEKQEITAKLQALSGK